MDKGSVAWGVLLSLIATGLFETIRSLMEGKFYEETTAFLTTVIVSAILMVTFRNFLLSGEPRTFSCVNCSCPFSAYPPDDMHNVATRSEKTFEDYLEMSYKCKHCGNANTIYWGHYKPYVATG